METGPKVEGLGFRAKGWGGTAELDEDGEGFLVEARVEQVRHFVEHCQTRFDRLRVKQV